MFESPVNGQLEIHSGSMASSILEDTIPCSRLVIDQPTEEKTEVVVNPSLERSSETSSVVPAKQPVHS